MASTGLLTGVNPYRGGNVAVDFSSKPTQFAIQELQHQQAKAEATDKYYSDWEKSINPAGLAKGELDVFTQKLRDAKNYGIRNKEQINNPSKYGYDAQSTLTSLFRDAQNYIEEGKQATANRKAIKSYIDGARKSGKHLSGDIEVLNNAMKTVGQGYVEPDTSMIDIYDPHNEESFREKTWKGINLPGDIVTEKQYKDVFGANGKVIGQKETGFERPVKVEKITSLVENPKEQNPVAQNYDTRAKAYYRENKGTQEQYNKLFEDKDYVKQFNPIYEKFIGKKIESPEELLAATGLATKQPTREAVTEFKDPNKAKKDAVDLIYLKKHIDDMQIKNDFADTLTSLDSKAIGKSQINNPETGKNELWNRLPLPESIRKDFTVKTKVVKLDSKGNVTSAVYKNLPAQEILVRPNGDIVAHNNVLDEEGNEVSASFDIVQVDPKTLISNIINSGKDVSLPNKALAIKTATDNWNNHVTEKRGGWVFDGKSYTKEQLEGVAKASGVSVDEYKRSLLKKLKK